MITESVTLEEQTIHAIAMQAAQHTVEQLRDELARGHLAIVPASEVPPPPAKLVDAQTLSNVLGVSRDCVYDHAVELGGVRIGEGPRGRLRFDLEQALTAWTSRSPSKGSRAPKSPGSTGSSAGRRRRHMGSSAQLLPVKGSTRPVDAKKEPS